MKYREESARDQVGITGIDTVRTERDPAWGVGGISILERDPKDQVR